MTALTEAQFAAAQDALDSRVRTSRKDPEQKSIVAAQVKRWEDAIALPQRTVGQREFRLEAIALLAADLGLIEVRS
jgi:hypothetical protein